MACRVQVFARAPVSGEAKTRLIPRLGADGAAAMQLTLTERALAVALDSGIGAVELWCSPDRSHPTFAAHEHDGITLRDQGEGNVGTRMHRALSSALRAGDIAVLIGSDCPSLTTRDLRNAAAALELGADVALVPAEDGGYVLIAARTSPHHLFDGIDWGTSRVMEQTRARLRELDLTWHELEPRWDIDRPEDVDRLLREQPQILDKHP